MGNPPFPPFTSPLGRLRPEGMFPFHFILFLFTCFLSFNRLTLSFGDAAIVRPRLDKFYLDQINKVRTFPGRTFHDLVTLNRLAAWGLGPVPMKISVTRKLPVEVSIVHSISFLFFFFSFFLKFDFPCCKDNYNEGKQRKNSD